MDLISSISKHQHLKILTILASLLASCSHEKKNASIISKDPVKVEAAKYLMGPETPSSLFLDRTADYGLAGVQAVHLYAVDVDRDGYTDLITLDDYYAAPKFFLFNPKTNKFEAAPSPFGSVVRASYLNFVDLNRDGIYDVIVGVLNQKTEMTQYPARVFKGELINNVLHYKELAPLPTTLLPTASIAVLDFNLDGHLDLFLANWFSYKDNSPRPLPDLLLKGDGLHFTDSSLSLRSEYDYNKSDGTYSSATPTFGASVCDVDKNGFPDILTSNSNGYYNKLWLNLDGQNFVNYGNESGYAADVDGNQGTLGGGNTFFNLCGDYNFDGLIDVVEGNLSKDVDPESRDKSSVLSGTSKSFPPKFIRSEFFQTTELKRWSQGDRRGVWIDYNLDGLVDLLIDNSGFPPTSRLIFFEQAADHAYEDKSKAFGVNIINPAGTVSIDLNRDGVMDFISGQSKTRAGDVENRIYLFENQTKRLGRGSVRLHLQGKNSNYHGISSSLWLTTNHRSYFFNNEYNSGSIPSQNEEGAYFAYNKETPHNVTVRWSYGMVDRLNRPVPVVKKYNLSKLKLKGTHTELNLCEDGRILPRIKNCY